VPSQIAFDGHRLNSTEYDSVILELSQYLVDENLYANAGTCLELVHDKQSS
jgi:hypothetical protein